MMDQSERIARGEGVCGCLAPRYRDTTYFPLLPRSKVEHPTAQTKATDPTTPSWSKCDEPRTCAVEGYHVTSLLHWGSRARAPMRGGGVGNGLFAGVPLGSRARRVRSTLTSQRRIVGGSTPSHRTRRTSIEVIRACLSSVAARRRVSTGATVTGRVAPRAPRSTSVLPHASPRQCRYRCLGRRARWRLNSPRELFPRYAGRPNG